MPQGATEALIRRVLLVACLDGHPVGEVFLEYEPAKQPEDRRYVPVCPRSTTWRSSLRHDASFATSISVHSGHMPRSSREAMGSSAG
jgi:hypothetical protein